MQVPHISSFLLAIFIEGRGFINKIQQHFTRGSQEALESLQNLLREVHYMYGLHRSLIWTPDATKTKEHFNYKTLSP